MQYHLDIRIGGPCHGGGGQGGGQKFEVVADTGSSQLWVPGEGCVGCPERGAKLFRVGESCSAHVLGDHKSLAYGDGTSVFGTSFIDSVQVGDLHVHDQLIIKVDRMGSHVQMKSDGIMGLSHHWTSDHESRTFMSTLFREHPHLPKMFSFYLTGEPDQPSHLVFGEPNIAAHAKERAFRYGKRDIAVSSGLWMTRVTSIGWSGTGVEANFSHADMSGSPVLVDSGSSLILLASDAYKKLINEFMWRFTNCRHLAKKNILACDCPPGHDLSRIPSLVINIVGEDDQPFPLCMSPDEYILEYVDPDTDEVSCFPAIQDSGAGGSQVGITMILGMTFMRSFYTNFDVANKRVGFARSNKSPLPAGAVCSTDLQPAEKLALWVLSACVALCALPYAFYVCCVPKDACGALCAKGATHDGAEPVPMCSPRDIMLQDNTAAFTPGREPQSPGHGIIIGPL